MTPLWWAGRRSSPRHPVQRAQLVAVGVAQIGEVERAERALAAAGRVLAGGASTRRPGLVPGLDLFRPVHGKPDRAAIGAAGRLPVDRLRHHEGGALVQVGQAALGVDPAGLAADGGKQRVVEGLRPLDVVAADHDVAEHSPAPSAHANRSRDRARAFSASVARSRAGAVVASESRSRRAASVTSSTARSKAAAFARDGVLKPESLRTNCSAEARTSSSVAGGSKLNSVRMLRHIVSLLAPGRGHSFAGPSLADLRALATAQGSGVAAPGASRSQQSSRRRDKRCFMMRWLGVRSNAATMLT